VYILIQQYIYSNCTIEYPTIAIFDGKYADKMNLIAFDKGIKMPNSTVSFTQN
jgi:hypothetical protein